MPILNLLKMAERFPNRWKTQWKKEKLLDTSNFSFSICVFKRLVRQTHKNQGLFGKALKAVRKNYFENMVEKGRICWLQALSPFSTMFSTTRN